jgi:hypothetical protein
MLLRFDLRGINICQSIHPFSLVYLTRFGEPIQSGPWSCKTGLEQGYSCHQLSACADHIRACLVMPVLDIGHLIDDVDVLSGCRGVDAPTWCRHGGVGSRGAFGTMRALFRNARCGYPSL